MKRNLFIRTALVLLILLLSANLVVFIKGSTDANAKGVIQYKLVPTGETFTSRTTQQRLQQLLTEQGAAGWSLVMRFTVERGEVFIFQK